MGHDVKLAVQLSHGDGLWVQDVGVRRFEGRPRGGRDALEQRARALQHLVHLGLPGPGGTDEHQAVSHHRRLVQLDALVDEA